MESRCVHRSWRGLDVATTRTAENGRNSQRSPRFEHADHLAAERERGEALQSRHGKSQARLRFMLIEARRTSEGDSRFGHLLHVFASPVQQSLHVAVNALHCHDVLSAELSRLTHPAQTTELANIEHQDLYRVWAISPNQSQAVPNRCCQRIARSRSSCTMFLGDRRGSHPPGSERWLDACASRRPPRVWRSQELGNCARRVPDHVRREIAHRCLAYVARPSGVRGFCVCPITSAARLGLRSRANHRISAGTARTRARVVRC